MTKNLVFVGFKESLFTQNKLNHLFTYMFAFVTNLPKLQSDKYMDLSSAKERIFPSVQFAIYR